MEQPTIIIKDVEFKITKEALPCTMCGRATCYIDDYDLPMCSPECEHEYIEKLHEFEEAYMNVIVQIVKCRKCGHREILWYKTDDTQELTQEEMEAIENGE